jgi:hypothetical protein
MSVSAALPTFSRMTSAAVSRWRSSRPSAQQYSIASHGAFTPAAAGPDTTWPTPEHRHRCNQKSFEPVLFAHGAEQPRISILHRTEIADLAQGEQGVPAPG